MNLLNKIVSRIHQINPKNFFKVVFTGYFLFGMHYFDENMNGWGLYLPANIIGWIFVTTLIGIAFWQVFSFKKIEFSRTSVVYWLGFLFFLLPLTYSINKISYQTTSRILFLFGGLFFYTALIQFHFNKKERFELLYIILVAVVIQSIIGLVQYYDLEIQSHWALFNMGIPNGTFTQRNVMSTFMSTGIGISLYLAYKDSSVSESILKQFIILLIPLMGSIIILAHQSKVGYLGLMVLFLQLFNVDIVKRVCQYWFLMLFIGLIVGSFSSLNNHSFHSNKKGLYDRDSIEQLSSINSRITIYDRTFKMWKDNQYYGVGYGRWPRIFREYSAAESLISNEKDYVGDSPYRHPHNEILLWISEGGMAPLFGLLIFTSVYLIRIFQLCRKRDTLSHLALVLPIFLHTQFEYPFDISLAHWIIFLTLVYLPDDLVKNNYIFEIKMTFIIPTILIVVSVYYYMAKTFVNTKILMRYENSGMKDNQILLRIDDPGLLYLKYENYILKILLDAGLKTKNEEILKLFIEKGRKFISHFPKLHLYHGIKIALLTIGQKKEAEYIDLKARYLFPYTYNEFHKNVESKKSDY